IMRCINSVAGQTLVPKEVILIDDASPDGTLEMLHEIEKNYAPGWIKVFHQRENSGPGSARNRGWQHAKYPYIAFLDSDDTWHPKKIEIQYEWLREHPDIVLCGHETRRIKQFNTSCADTPSKARFFLIKKNSMLFRNRLPTRSVMIKR